MDSEAMFPEEIPGEQDGSLSWADELRQSGVPGSPEVDEEETGHDQPPVRIPSPPLDVAEPETEAVPVPSKRAKDLLRSTEGRPVASSEKENEKDGVSPDIEKLSLVLEQQLDAEVVMSAGDDFEELEREFLEHREEPISRLQHACACVRSGSRDHRMKGVRILTGLEKDGDIDEKTLFYYLSVGNYRLKLFQEAQRFCTKLLALFPTHRQGNALALLLKRKLQRKLLVCVDGSEEADLAFNRALEIHKEGDTLIVHTEVSEKELKKFIDSETDRRSQESMTEKLTEQFGEKVLRRYTNILDDRGIEYCTVIECGKAAADIVALIHQESVDTVILGFGEARSAGLFSRALKGNTSSYVYYNAECDVIVVKKKTA